MKAPRVTAFFPILGHIRTKHTGGYFFIESTKMHQDYGCCGDVIPVPILSDNYAYLLVDRVTKKTACIDPAEPEKLLKAAEQRGLTVDTVLCTHHHLDHAGGNEKIARLIPGINIVSTAYESIPAATTSLKNGDEIIFGSLKIKALYTPCHTRGHILFYITSADGATPGDPILFSGDTLFVAGCGRFFEGDAAQMTQALTEVIPQLPKETKIFCGHEYTLGNLRFALSVEPDNPDTKAKLDWAEKQLKAGKYTVPSTIAEELNYNPFMRVKITAVQNALGTHGAAETMASLREKKNNF